MSNPFEKYFQATERQHDKINRMTPNWEIPASSPFVPFDTSLDARYSELNKPYTPDPTLKSAGDVLVDAAASALKIPTIIGGVAVGAADLALSAASKPIEGYMRIGNALAPNLIPEPMDVGYGYIAKGLHDTIGYRPEEAKAFIDEKLFSDARKIQEKEYKSGYTAAEDKAFQDSWTKDYQTQYTNLQQSGATEQQLKDFSTGFDKQYQQAASKRADKYQTSWDKPLSENIGIIGHGFDNLLENPSLALGGAIESGGYLLPSMLVSRGVLALEKAAKVAALGEGAVGAIKPLHRFAAAGVGEGSVAGTVSLEQMRSQTPNGIAGGKELLGALGVAASTGLIGTGFGKAASKLGIGDIDAAGLGRAASQVAAMKLPALARPVGAVAQEGAEEFAQTFGESIIPNVTMGKDPLEGLGQELPMGTLAGAIMGAGMNAPSLVSGGFSDISSGLGKVKGAVSDAASLKSFDTLSNPKHKNYNPAQAFNIQLKNLESADETVRTQAEASVSKIETDLNTARASVEKRIKSIQATLKAMPPSDQTTDAQKLEIEALGKEYSELTTKSSTLADQYVAFLDAQVTAQEHRDVQQGTQFTEEQAKADIATLTQPKPSQTVWSKQDTDIPVEVIGEPETDEQGNQFTKVRYIPQEGADPIEWYVPTSELISTEGTNDVAQKEALDRVTRHFSKYSNDDLDLLATSPVLTETQRNSLRLMSESKRQLAAVQNPSQVFDNILNGYKGKTAQESHRGLNQYTDMVNTAVATKNEQLASLALDGLGAFTDDHTAKRDVINEAFGLVQKGTYKEIHALRTQEGTWGLVPFTAQEVKAGKNAAGANYLNKAELNKVGGFNVHINSDKNGAITQINNETQLIQGRFDALSGVAESFVGVAPKPVDTSIGRVDLVLPIGTSGSGKSTWIKSINQNKQFVVISPDEMRVEFTGDMNDKSKDKEIYEEAAKRTVQAIREGKQVVFDTTNLTKDKRRPFIEAVKKAVPNANIQYKLMPLNPDLAKQRIKADIQAGVNRANVSDATIDRHTEAYKQMLEDIKDEPITPFINNAPTVDTSTASTVATPIITEPSDTTATVDNHVPEAPVQSEEPVEAELIIPETPQEAVAKVVPPVNVWAGSNENTGLSNLATRPFTFGTKKYQSVEHAYQTLKSGSFDQQTYDKYAGTENKKIAGNRGTKTTDNANVRLMEKLMTASFEQNKDAMELLQKTGDAVITHTQDKSIWGKEFPRILMEIRESNKAATPSQDTTIPSKASEQGWVEYFTKQAKNDPSIIKLAQAINKLRGLVKMVEHLKVLGQYVDKSITLQEMKDYLGKHPELNEVFDELKSKNQNKLIYAVIGDITEARDVFEQEMGKLVSLVDLTHKLAAFEKGQQYLIDTNYADLNDVISPSTYVLSDKRGIGYLAKNRVMANTENGMGKLLTPIELAFFNRIDGIPVGELSKDDFETVKALIQNRLNANFNHYEVVDYPRDKAKVVSDNVHQLIVDSLPREGFTLETFTPEQVINGAIPESFIWGSKKKAPETTENTGKDTTEVGFKLTPTGQYTPKDQLKADKATKFIGEGAANSSTAQYAKDAGNKANTGEYTKDDVVFVSVNGARANRKSPNFVEIQKAVDAGATILTDKLSDRERSFNVGEREVAAHLTKNGYVEEGNTGVWKPKAKTADDSQVLTELNLSAQEIQNVTFDLKNNVSLGTVNTNTSRQTAQLGSDYTYSGKTYIGQPIPTHIKAWMDAVNKALGTAYNSVLVQYYPANTKSGIGFHKDNEKEQFDINQPVVSLSIGQTIPFVVHEKLNTPVTFNLKSGDVFKFDGNKLHGIASQNHTGERYSLTLRQFHKTKTADTTTPVSEEAEVIPEVEQTSTESQVEPVATEDAKVTALRNVTDEVAAEERKKPFNLRNILKGYFIQVTTKENATGANPLVTIKDFISNFDVPTQVSKWLNDRRKPTEKQLAQVEHFKTFHAEFAIALDNVFNTQQAGRVGNKANLIGYMDISKKTSRKLEENVVTALALSAYSYLIKQGNKVMNTNEELETLFRFKKGMRAPLHIEQMFRFVGQEMPVVVKALGTDAAKALGLKVREDQDPTLQDRLNTSLGILAMEAMANAGFIVIETLQDHPTDEKNKPLTDFLTTIKAVRESKAHTIEDEYDFEVDTDAETQIKKFTMVRPNAKMEGIGNSVFEKGIIETEVDGKIVRTETLTLNRPVLTEGLPTLNSALVNELIEANKETKGFLSYLFGVDVGYTMPLKEMPKKFFQKLINGTDASVPSAQVALLTEAQKHSFTMRTNTVAVFAAMQKLGENSQFLKEVLGIWIDDHVLSRTHVTERDSLQAKAQNDWTAVLNGLEWAEATLDEQGQYQEFYDTQFVAQNQRQHLKSNMFSAQSSQIHRAMAALTGFSTTIDLSQDEQGTVKDEALLNLFYQAVGEGLEGLDDYLKDDILSKAEAGLHQFFTVDKVYGDYYVPALKAFLETDASKNAIKAMRVLVGTGTIDTTQQKAIAWFVGKGKMGAQSLQSLIALAELDIAQANGTTFTTTIGFGSDGVNHGVSAANMLTGVISKDMRQQTGIFPIAEKGEDQIDNMQEVYRRKITDYYVDFGKVMAAKLRDLIPTFVGKLNTDFVEGMQALFPKFEALDDTGELKNLLAMRKMAKIWAIPFNYSAGKAALQRALARGFLAGIYGEMNKLANEALGIIDAKKKEGIKAEELAALDLKMETVKLKTTTLQDNLNKVLGKYGMGVTLPEPHLLNEEDKGKLSNGLENTLMQAAIDLHGKAAWQATEEFAEKYLQVRNVYTEVEKASFTLFNLVRTQLIEEKKASRKYSNVATKTQTAEELNAQEAEYFGLTTVEMAEIDAVLAAMRPMFNTALSIGSESTNDAGSVTNPSGVSVRKHKIQREPANGLRAVNTFYGKEKNSEGQFRAEARNIGLTKEVEENAGVAASANAVQSVDAFVAAKIQGFMVALNAHDNAIFGLKDFLKGVKKQNEEHLKALTNYQLGLEHAKMLVKVYVGYKAFMATQEEALKSEDVKVRENAQKLITEAKQQMKVLLWGEQMFKGDTALVIDGKAVYKGGLIPKLQAANRDIKDNAEIDEAISVFIDYALKQDLQKLEVLLDTHSIHQFAGEGGMHQLTDENRASITEQEALVNKAQEDLQTALTGKPVEQVAEVKTQSKLVTFLEQNKGKEIPVAALVAHLKNETDVDSKTTKQQQEVLKAIEPLLGEGVKVIYEDATYNGQGYFDEATNTIHIKSVDSQGSSVNSHLAIHELLHSAFSQRIKAIRANPSKYPEAKAALDKLDELRQVILSRVKGNSVLSEMLKNVDEFISYGLTDQRLQQVLGAVPVERNGRTAPKVNSRWRTFILAVMKVTGFKSGGAITALSAFAMDTAALLETIGTVTPVVAPNNGERLFSTQSAEDRVNTKPEINKALEQAREAVRELLIQLNFKFVDSPNVNLSDIERIASKYLTKGKSNNDPAYLKDAAKALSYAIYFELGLPQGNAKMREWLQKSLLNWLSTGEVPKSHKSLWVRVVEVFNKLMAAFSGKEFKTIESRLEAVLNKIINREDFSFKPKQGYSKLVFQKEMTNNPLAVQSILTLVNSGIPFSLTGSIAYADQVPLYRQENKPLHDMDFLLKIADVDKAIELFKSGDQENWGDSFELYSFNAEGQKTVGMAIVPKGYTIKNAVSFWNKEVGAPQRSYDVHDVATGEKVGEYSFLRGVDETFKGIAGITIDLIGDGTRDTVAQTFNDAKGRSHTIEVSSYVGGFTAKLDMLRLKDITDFIGVVPPTERVLSKPRTTKPTEEPIAKPTPVVNSIAQYQAEAAVSNKEERRFSKNTPSGNGLTVASTRQILVKQFGEKLIKALEAKGLLRIVETFYSKNLQGTEGYYQGGQATLVAAGLTAETVVATLLHELGGHKGFQEMMEPAAYNALMKQFDKLVTEGNPIALAALKRAQEATGSEGKPLSEQGQRDEYLPYLLTIQAAINATQAQKSAIAKFIDNVFRAVRAWAYKKLQANGYEGAASTFMQPQDIVYTAERMLREMVNSSVVSSSTQSSIKFSTQSAEDLVNGQSSLDIMTALPHSNTGSFNQQLDRLIVEEIGQLYNQDEAAKARIDEIQTFTASDALNAGFILSRKEQYVQQALQYAVAAYMKLHAGGANVGQLRRVYHAAKVKISPTGKDFHEGDWSTATQQEQDAAKAKYDFLFDSTKEGYMDRFVSMALASESVSKILDIALPLTKPETQDKTWFEKVSDWVAYVMAWLTNKYVRLNPTAGASNQLVQLMGNLVSLDIRARQEGVAFHQKAWNSIGLVTTPLNNFIKKGQDAALKGYSLRNSRFLPVRALGAAIVLRSEEAAKVIPQLILDMRNNQLPHTKLGEAANILMEAASAGSMRNAFDVLTRQTNLNAKNRQDIVDNVKKAVNGWFKTPLTKMQHKAITYVLLRTDTQALLEDYSVEDIVNMALHEGKLNAEIAKLKKEIAKNPNGNGMLNAAEQLGYYMVTRIGGEGLVKNATGIAIGLGTQYFTSVEEADAKLVHQLDVLASMMAMSYTSNSDKGILAALYKTDKDGVHATINLHNGLVTQATGLFQDNPLNKVKGWMPEITNPYREIKTAESMAEREQMEAEGWVFVAEVKRDKHDKGNPKYLMKHNDIGYQRFVSGAVDLLNPSRSGTEAIDRTNPKYLGVTQARYQNAARRAAIPNGSFDPSKEPRGLITAYDTNGVPLAYNYEMDNETRDDVLDRNHNIGDLLGTFGGKNYYTPVKTKQNSAVAQVLFEDYRDSYSQNPNAYIKLSPKSTDPKVVEMWRMLPQDFRDQATALYGKGNPIIIRNEVFNFAFGFKKFSVVSYAFDTKAADRNKFQSGFVRFAEATSKFKSGVMGTFGGTSKSTAQADFAKAEHVTQEIVKAIKDFIVIRSGTTMFWNIFANVCLLMANGINPVTIIKDAVFAVINVRAYQKLNSQLIQAQADLVAGKDPVALKQKIGALKAELKANKMNPYINAGLLSSIVEDVNIQTGDYTYNSAFKQAVDEKTQWIPKPVKIAAKVLTIAPSTKLYQFLATTTQLSDFVAKYSMSKHLQANGMAMDESVVEASKTFINYDLPTSQGLQYANDMGLFMFTKFFLRIQAVLMKLMGKKAGSVIAQHILVESLTGAEGILSPSLLNHIDNIGIESSVFGLPSAFFSIGTVDAVTGLGSPF